LWNEDRLYYEQESPVFMRGEYVKIN
jgi:hypothetical protein